MTADEAGQTRPNHLIALGLLAVTLLFERFAYYGMRSVLLLHLTQDVGVDAELARRIYGGYTTLSYLATLGGAGLAFIVPRKVLVPAGVAATALGLVLVAAPQAFVVYAGLLAVVVGQGLYRTVVFALAAELLPGTDDLGRGAAFCGLYAAVNIGAWAAPLVVGVGAQQMGFGWGAMMAAFWAVLAFGSAITASLIAPRHQGPAPRYRPRPFLGALALIALAVPAQGLMTLLFTQQYDAAGQVLSGGALVGYQSVNPAVVIVGAGVLAGGLFVLRALGLRGVTSSVLAGAGALTLVLAGAPFWGGGQVSQAALYASAIIGALGELALNVALLSRAASAGMPHFGALAVSLSGLVSWSLDFLSRTEPGQRPLAGFSVAAVLTAIALVVLSGVLQRAFFAEREATV